MDCEADGGLGIGIGICVRRFSAGMFMPDLEAEAAGFALVPFARLLVLPARFLDVDLASTFFFASAFLAACFCAIGMDIPGMLI